MTDKNMGWQCPNCLVVYAPSVNKCECGVIPVLTKDEFKINTYPIGTITTNRGYGTTTTFNRADTSNKAYMCSGFISESPNGLCSKCGYTEWNHPHISYT